MAPDKLTVAVYAQLTPAAGGIAQALFQLVSGLGRLQGDEAYVVVTSPEGAEWLQPHVGLNTRLVVTTEHLGHTGPVWQRRAAAILKNRATFLVPLAERVWRRALLPLDSRRVSTLRPPVSDGFIESLGADVVHFPYQRFIRTSLPSIFEPWDLQHRHLPQFFDAHERRARDVLYRAACESATLVVTATDWTRRDIVEQLSVPSSKIRVIPRGSSMNQLSSENADAVLQRFRIPPEFALYPAHLWPHKNHLRLLEAIAQLRDASIHLVCTGGVGDYFQVVRRRVKVLDLGNQVTFTGHISESELATLYRRATCLVFPSLFEGYGFPLVEAMSAGLPIACSDAACLPEIAGEAARLFDPYSVDSIASALAQLWHHPAERDRLRELGGRRSNLFQPRITAETFRALYRELAAATPH